MNHVEDPTAAAQPGHNPWVIAIVVAMAAFMEILDTSIANVALPYMAGNLGVSNDESTWVLTSYLVSNAIILPISGWLAGLVGRKRFFLSCIGFFTLSSLLCGIAPRLTLCLFVRAFHGLGGGTSQPVARGLLGGHADGPGHSGGHFPSATTWHRLRALWHHRSHSSGRRTDPWWLDHL